MGEGYTATGQFTLPSNLSGTQYVFVNSSGTGTCRSHFRNASDWRGVLHPPPSTSKGRLAIDSCVINDLT